MNLVFATMMLAGTLFATTSSLTATPSNPVVGAAVSFAFTTNYPRGPYRINFGDGSPLQPVVSGQTVTHAYSATGTYTAQAGSDRVTLATATVTVAALRPSPTTSIQHVVTTSLSWPTGAGALNLPAGSLVPQPVALVRVDAPGAIVLQWLFDGIAVTNATQVAGAAGVVSFTLTSPLTPSGSHQVSVRVISPAPPLAGGPPPAAPIQYAYGYAKRHAVPPQFYNGPPPTVKIPIISAHTMYTEGVIELDSPGYGKHEIYEGQYEDLGIPLIDDQTKFQWTEADPQSADYFVLRVYDGSGTHVLAQTRISGTTAYTPTASFLQQVLGLLERVASEQHRDDRAAGRGKRRSPSLQQFHFNPSIFTPTLLWGVRGYKHFSQGGSVDLEVEKSTEWPLGLPDKPNGLSASCPSDPFDENGTTLQVTDLSASQASNGGNSIVWYPGDQMDLSGNVDFSMSPYATKVNEVDSPSQANASPPPLIPSVIAHDFDNVYVDWGDGTVAPLTSAADANGDSFVQRSSYDTSAQVATLPLPPAQPLTQHAYSWPGQYAVRVFQLNEADAQSENPAAVAEAASPPLNRLPMPSLHFASATGGGQASAIAGRAFTVYCHVITIDPVMDTVATGPLRVISAHVDFPGFDQNTQSIAALPALATMCDDSIQAKATVTYYGSGYVVATWKLNGVPIGSSNTYGRLSSPQRSGLRGNNPAAWAQQQPVIDATTDIYSPQLTTAAVGQYQVSIDIKVVTPDPTSPNLSSGVALAVGSGITMAHLSGVSSSAPAVSASSLHLAVLGPAALSSGSPTVGLSPTIVFMMQTAPSQVVGYGEYVVKASDPKQPCRFAFPTTTGTFYVSGLQGHTQRSGTSYSGSGVLVLFLNTSTSAATSINVPIQFKDWTSADGATVSVGSLDVSPSANAVNPPGIVATISRLQASAGQSPMNLTLGVKFADQTLRSPGSSSTPSWTLTDPVDSAGNWYAGNVTLQPIEIGWSEFQIESHSMAFDLSHTQGQPAAGACGATGSDSWVGADLGNATILPYTFGLVQNAGLEIPVSNWVVTQGGICGSFDKTIGFRTALGAGTVSIPEVKVNASGGALDASYPNMSVSVPWIDATLAGTATLVYSGQQAGQVFCSLTSPTVVKQFGPVRLTASNLQFAEEPGLGWTVVASADFHFDTATTSFADVEIPKMFFTMGGRPAFGEGTTTADIPLSGSTHMGMTPLDLETVHLDAATAGNDRLAFGFSTQARLSAVLPASAVQVNYDIAATTGSGPFTSPFSTQIAFPAGNPDITATIFPSYDPSSGANTRYYGSVDLSMLGGPPISAEFLLGYQGGSDYWLTRATVPLTAAGVPLVPGIMNLYSLQGGLGYHMALGSFQNTNSIQNAPADLGTDLIFNAGMQVGSPDDGFAYTFLGSFTVATGQNAGARMDYTAFLLSADHTPGGTGTTYLQGYFQYAGGNFDGKTWGGFNFMPGVFYASLGSSANDAAVGIHFGGGHWHVYAGQKNGQQIELHMLITDASGYIMIGDNGLSAGAGESIYLGVGDSSVVSAYISGFMNVDVTITPQPHIEGNFNAGASAGACVAGLCSGASVTAQVHAAAMPVDVDGSASLDLGFPVGTITISVHL